MVRGTYLQTNELPTEYLVPVSGGAVESRQNEVHIRITDSRNWRAGRADEMIAARKKGARAPSGHQ